MAILRNPRRLMCLAIRDDDLIGLITGKLTICDLGPEHEIAGIFRDDYAGCFVLKVYHPEYPLVGEGNQIPMINALIQRREG